MEIESNYSDSFNEQIFLVLTEYSFDTFKISWFNNYHVWAIYVKKHIESGNIDRVKKHIFDLASRSEKFLGFQEEELLSFVIQFFTLEKYKTYYEHVRLLKALYGGYVNK